MPTTSEITERYIREHRSIKECLKKGIINYSSLSRLIAKDLELDKKVSKDAILIAARRFKEKIKSASMDDRIIDLFKKCNIEIKNNIAVFTIEKNIYPDALTDIEKLIKKQGELFFAIEGTKTITLIFQKKNKEIITKKFKSNIIDRNENLSLITITSEGIWQVPGAVNYISGLFFENEINIEEFMSCYDDTLIVIKSENVEKTMGFLRF
jgi:uncharacterized protein YktA (UPF0223 family)